MSRRSAVLLGILLSGSLFLITRAGWITATVPDLAGGRSTIAATGGQASPATVALAVVALAASLVTGLTSRGARLVTGPLIALCGAGALVSGILVLTDPEGHAASAIAQASSVTGTGADIVLGPWAAISLLPSALLILLGPAILLLGRSWRTTSRFEREAAAPDVAGDAHAPEPARAVPVAASAPAAADPAALWDALTHGEDPTDESDPAEDPADDAPPRA